MSFEDKITAKIKDAEPKDVKVLNLDGCRNVDFSKLEQFTNLTSLSLNMCQISSLDGFPKLPKLQSLKLSDNRLTGGLDRIAECTQLQVLLLSGNRFKDMESIQPLKALTKLKTLDLMSNDLADIEAYRTGVFSLVPGLGSLDGADKDGKDVDTDEEDEEDEEEEDEEEEDEYEEEDEEGPPTKKQKVQGDEEEDGEGEEEEDEEGEEDEDEDEDDDNAADSKDKDGEAETGAADAKD